MRCVAAGCAVLVACALEPLPTAVPRSTLAPSRATEHVVASSPFSDSTRSPLVDAPPIDPRAARLAAACGTLDAALGKAARSIADDANEAERIEALLRMNGCPAVRPRIVSVRDSAQDEALRTRIESMHNTYTRCGVAVTDAGAVVVLADFLADLDPLPVRARTGAWLELRATVRVPVSTAKVIVMGPRGAPKTVPTTLDRASGKIHARFALDRPGAFTVQLLGDVEGGPRPLLQARVFADAVPTADDDVAPGEGEPTLDAMVAAVRREEGLLPLKRDPRLDALARAHAERMLKAGTVAHDIGDGDLVTRFEAEGHRASTVGENVARADTLPLAHRALYASPSHRLNLTSSQYTHFGVGVVMDAAGRAWACEVFSSPLR